MNILSRIRYKVLDMRAEFSLHFVITEVRQASVSHVDFGSLGPESA